MAAGGVRLPLGEIAGAGPTAFVLCVDEELGCAAAEIPAGMPVVPFRRRVDATAVMREVERVTAGAGRAGAAEAVRSSG